MKNLICNDELLHHVRANLNRFVRRTHEKDGYRRAAVAITIVDIQHDPGIYDIPFYDTWKQHRRAHSGDGLSIQGSSSFRQR